MSRKSNVCALGDCGNKETVYTLCKMHRDSFDIHVFRSHARRKAEERRLETEKRKQAEQAATDARRAERLRVAEQREAADKLPRPAQRNSHVGNLTLEAHTIAAVRQALIERSTRQLAKEIGISHFTVHRVAGSRPGDGATPKIYNKLEKWMGIS